MYVIGYVFEIGIGVRLNGVLEKRIESLELCWNDVYLFMNFFM